MFEQLLMGPFTRAQYILSIIFATLSIGVAGSLLVFGFAFPVLGASFAPISEGSLLISGPLFVSMIFFVAFDISRFVFVQLSDDFHLVLAFSFFLYVFNAYL